MHINLDACWYAQATVSGTQLESLIKSVVINDFVSISPGSSSELIRKQ